MKCTRSAGTCEDLSLLLPQVHSRMQYRSCTPWILSGRHRCIGIRYKFPNPVTNLENVQVLSLGNLPWQTASGRRYSSTALELHYSSTHDGSSAAFSAVSSAASLLLCVRRHLRHTAPRPRRTAAARAQQQRCPRRCTVHPQPQYRCRTWGRHVRTHTRTHARTHAHLQYLGFYGCEPSTQHGWTSLCISENTTVLLASPRRWAMVDDGGLGFAGILPP